MKDEIRQWIVDTIREYVQTSPENSLRGGWGEKAWDEPLVGFANGDDSLFEELKLQIGDFYWTPKLIFDLTFPGNDVPAAGLTVISWVLPQTAATKDEHRKAKEMPSERWVRSRLFGEAFNKQLHEYVVNRLMDSGSRAVAPDCSPFWDRRDKKLRYTSTWSHRHTAYISGLGTFGICDGLITPLGKAVRFGSVITELDILPTPRPYTGIYDYCLYYNGGKCTACLRRCPAGAITEKGHDKIKCRTYIRKIHRVYGKLYNLDQLACGLCQTAVPCESRIPLEISL